ncbi:hypothetical protein QEH59_18360 [Coraliomargarita sp. SDUM461004]|uniref:Uncharacterized protein n=1 Tax=Thalassobacterium sedimentorum TaxID=3041258 RepID=A0ABU1AQ83_9BACT|nr:hypothetical protein [Coraliomargarita sp. SDUM461004]MDQ8196398.1 hypothetical protein [Coraliomargarita sp. SDUM461004]
MLILDVHRKKMTPKQQQFITEVQTAVIIRCSNLSEENEHKGPWMGLIDMDEAFMAMQKIPEEKSAHEAACDFVSHRFDEVGDSENPPYWFMR